MMYERIRRLVRNGKAVSPVVGVILMVAITIVLAATIYIWISSMSSPAATPPSINLRGEFAELDVDGDNTAEKVLVLTVVSVQGDAKWDDLQISVSDDKDNTYNIGEGKEVEISGSGMVEAGDQITIDFSGFENAPSEITVQIIHVPSNSVIYENTFLVP